MTQQEQSEGQPAPQVINLEKQETRLLAQIRALRVIFKKNITIGLSANKKRVIIIGIEVKPYNVADDDEDDSDDGDEDDFGIEDILRGTLPQQPIISREKSKIKQKQNYFG